jgi:hypothetical protein
VEPEVILPPEHEGGALDDSDEASFVVVSRVRLPVTMMFELIRRANVALTEYEERYGEIRPPEEST